MTSASGMITPIILAGGTGTRLWPMSRSSRPKQFLALTGDNSLFQETLLRLSHDARYSAPIVVANEQHRFLVAEQALEVDVELATIILEPVARNTAPAIVAGTLVAEMKGLGNLIHVFPSDHQIVVDAAYDRAIGSAVAAARDGLLVTFGITPAEPATGFGYIEAGAALPSGAYKVKRFVEKPGLEHAMAMIESGNYTWNSGMFVFSAASLLKECRVHAQDVVIASEKAVATAVKDLDFLRLDGRAMAAAPDISIDFALFENTDRAAVVQADMSWSDLGSWDAVWKTGARDGRDNLLRGPATLGAVHRSLVVSERHHVVVDGLDDIAVIATEDAIYVGCLSSAQHLGGIVKQLRSAPATRALTEVHQTSYRPWGGYSRLASADRFQVKRLFVSQGKRLSLQKHHHRAEHWVVVRGTAEVQVNEKTFVLRENESVYIPQGAVHRLSNPGKIRLELIEVQTGSYLGEDDIVRIEDEFGRS